jgi:sugar-phosphatase
MKVTAQGLLFDMDGILISSLGSVERSWAKWAERSGLDVAETIQAAHGRRALETLRELMPAGDHQADLRLIEELEINDTEGLAVLPGVRRILESTPQRFWTIVTSATARLARARLACAGIPAPDRFVAADAVANGKPHPEPYLMGAALLGLPPASCIVVEDSRSGAIAGRCAGCRVLATTFSHTVEQLEDADWIVESLDRVQVKTREDHGIELEFEPLPRAAASGTLRR